VIQVLEIFVGHFGGGFAEGTSESAATVDELHEGAHVGLAAAAADRAEFAEVDDGWRRFAVFELGEGSDDDAEGDCRLLHHVWQRWNAEFK